MNRFKLSNYKKIFFFDFDDNIISLKDSYIYIYKNEGGQLIPFKLDTKTFGDFISGELSKGNLELLDTKEELNGRKLDKKYYIIGDEAYIDFRLDSRFEEQISQTLELSPNDFFERLGLSFPTFLEALTNGELIYIVTARGQSIEVISEGIIAILVNLIEIVENNGGILPLNNNKVFNLQDFKTYIGQFLGKSSSQITYEDYVDFFKMRIYREGFDDEYPLVIPATNPEILKIFNIHQTQKPEKGKIIKSIITSIMNNYNNIDNWLIGFSDDMVENIKKVEENVLPYIQDLAEENNKNVSLHLFSIDIGEENVKIIHI